jgi:hypothetical protein
LWEVEKGGLEGDGLLVTCDDGLGGVKLSLKSSVTGGPDVTTDRIYQVISELQWSHGGDDHDEDEVGGDVSHPRRWVDDGHTGPI